MSDWTPPKALVETVALVIDEVLNPPHLTSYEGADRIMRIALPLGEVIQVLLRSRELAAIASHPILEDDIVKLLAQLAGETP